jgi:hypothetical protein
MGYYSELYQEELAKREDYCGYEREPEDPEEPPEPEAPDCCEQYMDWDDKEYAYKCKNCKKIISKRAEGEQYEVLLDTGDITFEDACGMLEEQGLEGKKQAVLSAAIKIIERGTNYGLQRNLV